MRQLLLRFAMIKAVLTRRLKGVLWLMALLAQAFRAEAGVVVDGTRFIYLAKYRSLSVGLKNTDSLPVLINVKVLPSNAAGATTLADASAFVVTPPLFVLAARKEGIFRIILANGGILPQDRERLFRLSVGIIPAGKPVPNSVQMAIQQNFKLIYRPGDLAGEVGEAYKNLIWRKTAAGLSVENRSPFYVTLYNLKLNGVAIANPGVVEPFSRRATHWCQSASRCAISWQTLNDIGKAMPTVSFSL